MRIGMLWFDDSRERATDSKIERAARHYEAKYGLRPTVCYVHPSTTLGLDVTALGMEIRSSNMVLPHHFWLGQSEEHKQVRPAA